MRLLLTSGGIHESFKDDFLSLLSNKPLSEISVSYVITAAFGEKGDKSWVNIAKEDLQKIGIFDIENLDIRGKTKSKLYSILSKKDVILVNGGNTFYLLKYVIQSGFDKVIKKLIKENKLYIGVSAGSMIMSPTIETAYWEPADRNKVNLKDLKSLGLVNFLISPHFNEEERQLLSSEIKKTSLPVICLYDTQAVLVENNSIKVIGKGKREFFNGFKEITK